MSTVESIENQVIRCVSTALSLNSDAKIGVETALLGNLPEFDSQSVVTILIALEEAFEIIIEDDEVDAELFQTVGTLADYIKQRLAESA